MKLIVIDMQKGLVCDELYSFDGFIENVEKLIRVARSNNVEVIFVKHNFGEESGFTFGDEAFEIACQVAPRDDEKVFVKMINSCFGNEDFAKYLKQSGENELMIVGLQTDFCIDATVKSAFERGYKVYIPKGTNSTFSNDYLDGETIYKYFNEWVWPGTFAITISMNEAIKLLKNE